MVLWLGGDVWQFTVDEVAIGNWRHSTTIDIIIYRLIENWHA